MLIRFIIYSLIAYFAIRLVKSLLAKPNSSPRKSSGARSGSAAMVKCAVCGTYITERSALLAGNGTYCSELCAGSRIRTA